MLRCEWCGIRLGRLRGLLAGLRALTHRPWCGECGPRWAADLPPLYPPQSRRPLRWPHDDGRRS